jgi:hypothetical protein
MLVGYNTNISYKGDVYHIQTEDSGHSNPVIVTLLYQKGAILASRKTSYAQILSDADFSAKVRKIMQIQHKGMIRELLSGKFTGEHVVPEEIEATGDEEKNEVMTETAEEVSDSIAAETTDEQAGQQEDKAEAGSLLIKSLDDVLLNYIMKRGK